MRKKYHVMLTDPERTQLRALLRQGHAAARRLARAHIVVLVDEGHGGRRQRDARACWRPDGASRA